MWDCSRRGVPIAGHLSTAVAGCLASFCELMGIPYWFEPDTSAHFDAPYLEGESEDYVSTDIGSDGDSDSDDEYGDDEFDWNFNAFHQRSLNRCFRINRE